MIRKYENFPLKNVSWVKIGGPADRYIEIDSNIEFIEIGKELVKNNEKFELLGFGANTLISDNGLKKSVIKNKSANIEILENKKDSNVINKKVIGNQNQRHKVFKDKNITSGYDSNDLNYDEPEAEDIFVKIDSGAGLPFAISYLIKNGITGLQMFSGIPGTVGGSTYNNIHGGTRLLSEFIHSVEIIDEKGELLSLEYEELEFDYNKTRFHRTNDIIVSVTFRLKLGDQKRAQMASHEWIKRKSSQPRNSLGSVFHNLSPEQQQSLNLPTPSIAYLIEHVLKLSGYRIGGIMIPEKSEPDQVQVNKNIFMNIDNGTASDFLAVMKKVAYEAKTQLGINLKPEIFLKGFNKDEIKEFFE